LINMLLMVLLVACLSGIILLIHKLLALVDQMEAIVKLFKNKNE
jgi:hypothetical protein